MKRTTKMARDCCDCGVIVASGDLRCRRCAELRKRRAEIRDLRARLDAALAQVEELREALAHQRVSGDCALDWSHCKEGCKAEALLVALASTPAPTRAEAEAWLRAGEPVRGALAVPAEHDYSGLCAAPSCEGHCGYVHARGCEAVREYLADHGGKPYRAPSPPDILHRVAERAMWLTAERLGERLNEVEGVRYTMANIDGTAIDTAAIIKEATRG